MKVFSLKKTFEKIPEKLNLSVPVFCSKSSNSEMMRKINKKHRRPTVPGPENKRLGMAGIC